jgi:hypothetical protein
MIALSEPLRQPKMTKKAAVSGRLSRTVLKITSPL